MHMNALRLITLAGVIASGCSTTHDVERQNLIGAAGGQVSLTDGDGAGASIQIPAGALTSEKAITISVGATATDLPSGAEHTGPTIVLGPEGQTFINPVSITLPSTVDANAVFTRPVGGSAWTRVDDVSFDSTRHVMIAHVSHFSEFVPADVVCAFGEGDATESCNGEDDDCDGIVDEGCPASTDAGLVEDGGTPEPEDAGVEADGGEVPTDAGVVDACAFGPDDVPGVDICNSVDDDCDGIVDEDCDAADASVGMSCATDADCGPAQVCVEGVCIGGP